MRRAVDLGVLGALGAGLIGYTVWLGDELDPGDFGRPLSLLFGIAAGFLVLYACAALWIAGRRPPRRAALAVVFLVAAVARLLLVPGETPLSNDVYRYVWDGRIQAEGINPYRYAPADPALAELRDEEIYAHLNREEVRTIYPPVAQGLFRLLYEIHPDSVTWTKLALVSLDLAAVGLLAWLLARLRRPPEWSIAYAWHPLAIFEIGSSGHVEGVAVLLVLLALHASLSRRAALAGVLAGAAGLVKFYAAAVFPALLHPGRRLVAGAALAATAVLAYLPFLGAGRGVLGYLPDYLEEEGVISGTRFYPLDLVGAQGSAAAAVYGILAGFVLLGLAARYALAPGPSPTGALALVVAALVLFTPTYPWYALLAIALLPLGRGPVLLPAGAVALLWPLLYLHISGEGHPRWPRHLVYGACLAALGIAAAWAARQRIGTEASCLMPSAKETSDRNPSTSSARVGEAKTWRTSPRR